MRKYLKKQILSTVNSLQKANKYINESIKNGKTTGLFDVLQECQDCAIEIGEQLELRESNINDLIGLLEKYCELVYRTAISVEKSQSKSAQLLVHEMKNCLQEIVKRLYESPEDKLEVVFLPYKKSMWTCMQSIYEAFAKEEDCNTYVIPIPYYDIGETQEETLQYEGENYEWDVPIIDWRDYDLEQKHPDVIIIHNPYDDTNNLTRVEEAYFSVNLKPCTECLVYSPYFTYGNYLPGHLNHLYVNPATIVSDKIIVQSEKVRDIFKQFEIEEQKLMVVGSPKIDVIINNVPKAEMPLEWKEKLDGKKVFLLNTHLAYFGKSYLNREKNGNVGVRTHDEIFDAIIDKPDVAMIWRPHPLMFNMLRDRFPECLEYAENLVKRIQESKNCVLDLQGDYIPAFKYSDAMISTWSSLINEYMVTGKPVLIFQKQPTEEVRKQSPVDRGLCYFRFGKNRLSFAEYIDMVKNGEDVLKEKRMEMINKAFVNVDGKVGERVCAEVKKYLEDKIF